MPRPALRDLVAPASGVGRPHPAGLPVPAGVADRRGRRHADHRIALSRRTPGGCASSPPATGCRTPGSTWRRTRRPRSSCEQLGVAPSDTPVVIWRGNQVLRKPDNADLARVVGLRRAVGRWTVRRSRRRRRRAGRARRRRLRRVGRAVDGGRWTRSATGGQAGTSSRIENYLGFPAGISGAELADRAVIQAEKFGATISVPAEAIGLEARDGFQTVRFDDGTEITTHALVIATGARYRRLDVPRLDEFEGSSVYYAATVDGGAVLRASAGGRRRRWQLRRPGRGLPRPARRPGRPADPPRRPGPRHVPLPGRPDRAESGHHGAAAHGGSRTGGRRRAVARPSSSRTTAPERTTSWTRRCCSSSSAPSRAPAGYAASVALDPRGYICTGPDAAGDTRTGRPPTNLETSRPGVFAVGDVRSGSIKRVASAVGEGAMAVRLIHEYLARP